MNTLNKCVLLIAAIGGFFTARKKQNLFINGASKVSKPGFMEWKANLMDKAFHFHIPVERLPEMKGKLVSLYLYFFELFYIIYK